MSYEFAKEVEAWMFLSALFLSVFSVIILLIIRRWKMPMSFFLLALLLLILVNYQVPTRFADPYVYNSEEVAAAYRKELDNRIQGISTPGKIGPMTRIILLIEEQKTFAEKNGDMELIAQMDNDLSRAHKFNDDFSLWQEILRAKSWPPHISSKRTFE